MMYKLAVIWLGVNSTGESCTVLFIFIFHSYDVLEYRFCGHSMGVIPGLVSIPVVKSFCVLFVYYGFLWEFHFAASFLLLQLLLTYLLITYHFHISLNHFFNSLLTYFLIFLFYLFFFIS